MGTTLFSNIGVTNASAALSTTVNNVISDRAAKGKKLQSMVMPLNGSLLQGRSCIAAFQNGVAQALQSGTQLFVTFNMNCEDDSPDADYMGGSRLPPPAWTPTNCNPLTRTNQSSRPAVHQ
jgi:hypothetical protein